MLIRLSGKFRSMNMSLSLMSQQDKNHICSITKVTDGETSLTEFCEMRFTTKSLDYEKEYQ